MTNLSFFVARKLDFLYNDNSREVKGSDSLKNKKGFMASVLLYPLFLVFLALLLKLFMMSDARRKILDQMKVDIVENNIEDIDCICNHLLKEKKYIIQENHSDGSFSYNIIGLRVAAYENAYMLSNVGRQEDDIAVMTNQPITESYVSQTAPMYPKEGEVWIVQDRTEGYEKTTDSITLNICYVLQYVDSKWVQRKTYIYEKGKWDSL